MMLTASLQQPDEIDGINSMLPVRKLSFIKGKHRVHSYTGSKYDLLVASSECFLTQQTETEHSGSSSI